jgi:hypothetical protein
LDKAEETLRSKKRKVNHWWNSMTNEDGSFQFTKTHVFQASFALGLAVALVIHH